ncbi:hypothetical protein V6N13_038108 [Hibiscus sabdariffa]
MELATAVTDPTACPISPLTPIPDEPFRPRMKSWMLRVLQLRRLVSLFARRTSLLIPPASRAREKLPTNTPASCAREKLPTSPPTKHRPSTPVRKTLTV